MGVWWVKDLLMGSAGGGVKEASKAFALACIEGVRPAEAPDFFVHFPAVSEAGFDPGIPCTERRRIVLAREGWKDVEGRGTPADAFRLTRVHIGVEAGVITDGKEKSIFKCKAIHLSMAL